MAASPRRAVAVNPTIIVTPIVTERDAVAAVLSAASSVRDAPAPAAQRTPGDAPYGTDVRSVLFLQTTAVRKAPRADAALVGVVKRGTHAGVQRAILGANGCATGRWVEIAPRGWACDNVLEPSDTAPTIAAEVPLTDVDDDDVVPGVYGFVHGANALAYSSRADALAGENGRALTGATSIRGLAILAIGDRRFWRTADGSLIDEDSIYRASPSKFKGVAIDDPEAMPAWTRGSREAPIKLRDDAGRITGTLAPRMAVSVLEASDDGKRVRISDRDWVARRDLKIATVAPPPPGTAADEKWFDVDLDGQILVAYEGSRPVYATLVSTGKWGHETPASIARIMAKHRTATMTSDKKELYSVADVPWTMYYDRDFALHASYWHDGFGGPRSHGCVNLAPRDARVLYQWSSPDVPAGWTSVYADEDNPGSMVRVRSRTVPEPTFRGYARTMRERDEVAAR